MSRPHRVFRAAGSALLGASLLLTLSVGPVAARTAVDPGTLNPAPPDFFNARCTMNGQHILCTLAFSDPDVVDEPSGIVCGSTELLFSQARSVTGKRTYSAGGDLLQRHFIETLSGTFTNPDTGLGALWTQHDSVIHDLGTPGDLASGTTHTSGRFSRVWLPGGGTVLTDTGTFVVDEGAGESIRQSRHHPFDEYFTGSDPSALAALCDALD